MHFGELRPSNELLSDSVALRNRLNEDGYLFLRGLLDRTKVLAARREMLERLVEVDEIDLTRPLMEAFASGVSRRSQIDLRAFQRALRTGRALQTLCGQGEIIQFYENFLGGPVRPLDFIWVRTAPVGFGTGCHIDRVYMSQGTANLFTSWIPLGDVPRSEGTLVILEGSHKIAEKLGGYRDFDVDRDPARLQRYPVGWFSTAPQEVQQQLGGRWLTADFQAGDVLVFTQYTMHCSLDNCSPEKRIRLSVDARYQLASEPADARWVGANPPGHTPAFERSTV
jgi:ectoine hydroxylase-related dioxygenase (phytanoyl-CoA dioxygenase family)